MTAALFSEDQRDALQELTNIGMGQAGASVAAVLGEFVQLSVPRILVLKPNLIPAALERIVGARRPGATAVRIALRGNIVASSHARRSFRSRWFLLLLTS